MLRCPACGATDNITYRTRHQLVHKYDTDTQSNVITLVHNDPQCGYAQTYWIEDCLEDIFPYWVNGPRPEPRNQGILTEDQLRQLGFDVPVAENPMVVEEESEDDPNQMSFDLYGTDEEGNEIEPEFEVLESNSEEE